ncbi:uncharacterized protein CTRU02_206529 [Colletotrichum truncatum]|uniref:Uncharacterized protein n=1 Tax=Colletotrichum truncatum TaxID=5467 RepID=A0ACC3Z777_COLTU|nr:uncharacterized protein CTRU02_11899 [Colletotrichum truncatum]KAF6785274.1 hypothetical protein CTRU02_11899 [Colletotrichum truncatum]
MAPKKNTATEAGAAPTSHVCTESEISLMVAMLKFMPRPSTFNLEKITQEIGAASPHSTRERIRVAGNKHGWFQGATGASDGTPKKSRTPKAPGSGVGRKKKAPSDDDEAAEQETPSKKKARTSKAKAAAADEIEKDDVQDAQDEDNTADGQV